MLKLALKNHTIYKCEGNSNNRKLHCGLSATTRTTHSNNNNKGNKLTMQRLLYINKEQQQRVAAWLETRRTRRKRRKIILLTMTQNKREHCINLVHSFPLFSLSPNSTSACVCVDIYASWQRCAFLRRVAALRNAA